MSNDVAHSQIAPRDAGRDTIIIGAGPAGLAVGACLKGAGLPFLILEQSDQVGAAWHRHYNRLHLHTDKAHSALPFVPFPKEVPRYPSRLEVIRYLERYAQQFQLRPRLGQQVVSARFSNGLWEVETQDARYRSENLVIATGYNREPYLPHWPGQTSFRGTLLHASQYRDGLPFKSRRVLVVGFGNSGGEIALDLWEQGARPSLAVRSPVNVIPRELFGIPILSIGLAQRKLLPPRWADRLNALILRAAIGDLTRYGLRKLPYGPATQIRHDARIPLIDVGTIKQIKQGGITVCPGIERFTEEGVRFTDGDQRKFEAVILATGYRPRVNAFLEGTSAVYDENGTPLSSGREAPIPGLYFCGYHVSATGMLREIAFEAQRIVAAIGQKRV
ncbi:MAG: NAD(P)/FAD-dependent oxidoreductase [Nitrospirae bacterium]|nr:NAD(P)/FAD-dependent oxidoreductase [Candidatus Manganitrophaceae bacterium]